MSNQRLCGEREGADVIALSASRVVRNPDTGRQPSRTFTTGDLATFRELPIGATFRMWAGKWSLTKNSATTALRTDRTKLDWAHDFEGDERCVIM